MNLAWPWILLALPLPWLLRAALGPAPAADALRLPRLPAGAADAPRVTLRHAVAVLAWLLLVAAAARPQLAVDLPAPPQPARSILLAFDVSMSMATPDLRHESGTLERLQAARLLADAWLTRAGQNRAGLLVFGSQAYLHTPLTRDLQAVRAALGSVQAGLAGRETALGDAVALGVKYLKEQPAPQRDLVLLTDGANTAGTLSPERAVWLAQREGVRIHALGIGASAALDEAALRNMCERTGGLYMRAVERAAAAAFFDRIAPSGPAQVPALRSMRELYPWPLALAMLLAAALAARNWREARA